MKPRHILSALCSLLSAACPSCTQRIPAHWPPSPPVKAYEAHKPWGPNWHRDHP